MPRGVPKIEVTYDIDSNGILSVSAKEMSSGKAQNITIENEKGRLSKEDIDRMVNEAEKFKQEDQEMKEKIEARNELENAIYSTLSASNSKDCPSENKTQLENIHKEYLEWFNTNPNATVSEYKSKLSSIQQKCASLTTPDK